MVVTVKFFASLRESMGSREIEVDAAEVATVEDAWHIAGGGRPIPNNILAAVNFEYAHVGTPVRAGDEVAFFPPVTGG